MCEVEPGRRPQLRFPPRCSTQTTVAFAGMVSAHGTTMRGKAIGITPFKVMASR
jgi:hypothetical protein